VSQGSSWLEGAESDSMNPKHPEMGTENNMNVANMAIEACRLT
jgi:hypothetical protein